MGYALVLSGGMYKLRIRIEQLLAKRRKFDSKEFDSNLATIRATSELFESAVPGIENVLAQVQLSESDT
ncbi:MAG: hypothetical protein WCA24_08425 [Thiomonas sp.]